MAIQVIKSSAVRAHSNQRKLPVAANDFRHVTNIMEALEQIQDDLAATEQLLKKAAKDVKAATLFRIDETDIKQSPEGEAPAKPKMTAEELEVLQKHYTVTRRLYQSLNDLNALEATMKSSFPEDSKDAAKLVTNFASTRKVIVKQLNDAFVFLRDAAQEKMPPTFERFTQALGKVASRSLAYDSVENYVYVFTTDAGNLAFAHYTTLKNLVDEEGQMFPTMNIVATMVIGTGNEKNQVYLTTMRDFVPPSDDLLVKRITDIKAAVTALSFLLDLEHVNNTISHLPVPLLIAPGKLDRKLFSYNKYIEHIAVDEETGALMFKLKPTVKSNDQLQEITIQLHKDVQAMCRSTRSKLRITLRRKDNTVVFYMTRPGDAPAAQKEDVDMLADRFNLPDDVVTRILRLINH